MFYEYFDSGMGITKSQKYHEQLLELKEDFTLEHFANGGINPGMANRIFSTCQFMT